MRDTFSMSFTYAQEKLHLMQEKIAYKNFANLGTNCLHIYADSLNQIFMASVISRRLPIINR